MKTDNELIAEFMGWKKVKNQNIYILPNGDNIVDPKFTTSWDWLMPVVKNIDILIPPFKMSDVLKNGLHNEEYMAVTALPLATPISEVHKAIVEFIKWYNQQLKL